MKAFRIVWGIVINLVQLVVIFAVLNAGSRSDHGLLVSGLVLLYIHIVFGFQVLGRSNTEVSLQLNAKLDEIKRLLEHSEESEEEIEEKKIADEFMKGTKPRYVMNISFQALAGC